MSSETWSWASIRRLWVPKSLLKHQEEMIYSLAPSYNALASFHLTSFPWLLRAGRLVVLPCMRWSFLSYRRSWISRCEFLSRVHSLIFALKCSGKSPEVLFLWKGEQFCINSSLNSKHSMMLFATFLPHLSTAPSIYVAGRETDNWTGIEKWDYRKEVKPPPFIIHVYFVHQIFLIFKPI